MTDICTKPTYYFRVDGAEVSYIEHAAFISAHSGEDPEMPGYWRYPMLDFQDRGHYNAIILRVTRYESKPLHSKSPLHQPDVGVQEWRRWIPAMLEHGLNKYGLKLRELSAKTGLSIPYLSDIKRGRTVPTIDTLDKIVTALGGKLMMWTGDPQQQPVAPEKLRSLLQQLQDIIGKDQEQNNGREYED